MEVQELHLVDDEKVSASGEAREDLVAGPGESGRVEDIRSHDNRWAVEGSCGGLGCAVMGSGSAAAVADCAGVGTAGEITPCGSST